MMKINMTAASPTNVGTFIDNALKTSSDNETFLYQVTPIYRDADKQQQSIIQQTAILQALNDNQKSDSQFQQITYSNDLINIIVDGTVKIINDAARALQNATNQTMEDANKNITNVVNLINFCLTQLGQNNGMPQMQSLNNSVNSSHATSFQQLNQATRFT